MVALSIAFNAVAFHVLSMFCVGTMQKKHGIIGLGRQRKAGSASPSSRRDASSLYVPLLIRCS